MNKQLTIEGFDIPLQNEPKNINDKAKNIYIGIMDYNSNLLDYIKNSK